MNDLKMYYDDIEKCKQLYENLLSEINKIQDNDKKLTAISNAAYLAAYYNNGYWTSSDIEIYLINVAKSFDISNYDVEFEPNSFLHVMTTGYSTGGHTRVVERWIKNSDNNQKHSVLMTCPEKFDMSKLIDCVKNRQGDLVLFDNNSDFIDKAKKLREIALKYQYIILHVHPEDIIPTLAFGNENFKRPVMFYNHARHFFWVGKAVSDIVLDIIKEDEISKIRRNISDTYFLGVPTEEVKFEQNDKIMLRKKLGLPIDKKIIISAGNNAKYCPIGNNDYGDIINKIIDEDTYCYVIGMKKNNKKWRKAFKNSKGHIIPLGYISYNKNFTDYLACADLYIDSYPLSGGTALIDAVSQRIPSLSLKAITPQLEYFTESEAYCLTKEDFIIKAKRILTDSTYAEKNISELQDLLLKYQSVEAWKEKTERLISIIPEVHRVRDLTNEKDVNIIDDISVMDNHIADSHFTDKKSSIKRILKQKAGEIIKLGILRKRVGIPFIFEILSYFNSNRKVKVFKLFNITVYTRIK